MRVLNAGAAVYYHYYLKRLSGSFSEVIETRWP